MINDPSINKILFKFSKINQFYLKKKLILNHLGVDQINYIKTLKLVGINIKNFINVLVSLEKSTNRNGCLYIDVSGNNCFKIVSKKMKPLKKKELKNPKFRKILLAEGDIIFFNSYTPHFSYSNNSKKSRTQIYITYNKEKDGKFRSKYIKDKENLFHQISKDPLTKNTYTKFRFN